MKRHVFCLMAAVAVVAACDKGVYEADWGVYGYKDASASSGGEIVAGDVEEGGSEGDGAQAGVLTAGEWNDLDNWAFWGNLMTLQPQDATEDGQDSTEDAQGADEYVQTVPDYAGMAKMWGFDTSGRVAVNVKTAGGAPVVNAKVELLQGQDVIWTAKTSNEGNAELWQDLFSEDGQNAGALAVRIEGKIMDTAPVVSTFDADAVVNSYTVTATSPEAKADIAFIVDATGSMTDEIDFLKEDLLDILQKLQQSQSGVDISTGAVFYRDEGDAYVTKYNDFTTPAKTISYVKKQAAEGGGDLPEAVHSALETALGKLSWNAEARARMAFLILDAPAHVDHQGVVESLQKSIQAFSAQGIRIVPVLCSTWDKTTEFMCRDFAIVTGGTYVFLTDDSGVGGSHLVPTVGEYEVEALTDLLYRLMEAYIR